MVVTYKDGRRENFATFCSTLKQSVVLTRPEDSTHSIARFNDSLHLRGTHREGRTLRSIGPSKCSEDIRTLPSLSQSTAGPLPKEKVSPLPIASLLVNWKAVALVHQDVRL